MQRLIMTVAVASVALVGFANRVHAEPCATARAAHKAGELAKAYVLFQLCTKDAAAADADRRAVKTLRGQLQAGSFAPVAFAIQPDTAELRLPDFAGDQVVRADTDLWLPKGEHRFVITLEGYATVDSTLNVDSTARVFLPVRLEKLKGTGATDVDFGEEGPAVEKAIVTPDLQPKKHKNLIPERFRLDEHGRPIRQERRWRAGHSCAIWMF